MLKAIQDKLGPLVGDKWHELESFRGGLVDLYRRYYDGEHRLKLTTEMKKMMQINDDRLDRYNANYSEMVVNSMSDRLHVDGIEVRSGGDGGAALVDYLRGALPAGVDVKAIADTLQMQFAATMAQGDAAQLWMDGIMEFNRFDALQIDVHIATIRDGVTYVMAQWDEAAEQVMWAHEPAFDGDCGMMVVWDSRKQNLRAGVKIWRDGNAKLVNIYFEDRVEYYMVTGEDVGDGALEERKPPVGTHKDEGKLGVPIVPFMNKAGDRKRPKSELLNVIPLQDTLNRGLVSLIMAEELTAFRILLAKGVDVSGGIMPGMILKVLAKNDAGQQLIPTDADMSKALADFYNSVDMKSIEGSPLEQFIRVADFVVSLMGAVSQTPIPQTMGGDDSSGEALKQRESGLLGKAQRAHVQIGNSWEDVAKLSSKVQGIFGNTKPPDVVSATTRWKSAQVRNDAEIQQSAEWYWSKGFKKQALRVMSQSSLASHKEADIDRLLAEARADAAQDLQANAQGVPGFGQFAPLEV